MGETQWRAYAKVLRQLPPRCKVTRMMVSERPYGEGDLSIDAVVNQVPEAGLNTCSLIHMVQALGCANSTIQRIEILRVNQSAWLEFPSGSPLNHLDGIRGPSTVALILRGLARAPIRRLSLWPMRPQ